MIRVINKTAILSRKRKGVKKNEKEEKELIKMIKMMKMMKMMKMTKKNNFGKMQIVFCSFF